MKQYPTDDQAHTIRVMYNNNVSTSNEDRISAKLVDYVTKIWESMRVEDGPAWRPMPCDGLVASQYRLKLLPNGSILTPAMQDNPQATHWLDMRTLIDLPKADPPTPKQAAERDFEVWAAEHFGDEGDRNMVMSAFFAGRGLKF